ncbi:ABC transporter permease [Celerinatantimonas sp. MCCC 1A17872]|uniref:ABC transporter permease n=1 Tax=Celerinatantimonas sp. MCCC 1A17872 TaxID=3177514 RepID=UPI0038C33FB9
MMNLLTLTAPKLGISTKNSSAFSPTRIQASAVRIAIVILVLLAAVLVDGFTSAHNISSILFMTVSVGIAACGLSMVTISGNLFMLSMSATTSVCTIVFASTLQFGISAAIVMTLLVGLICGILQGLAVGVMKANPIITTIAASSIITGIGSWFSGGRTITSDVQVPWLGIGHIVSGVPNQFLILLLVWALASFFLSRMRLGREIKLIGINKNTAQLSGLRLGWAITAAYMIAALTAALTGILIASQTSQGNLSLGSGLDFSAIAAVLIGGVAITGGQGRISDAVFGALFLAIISDVLLLKGFSLDIQLMVKGAVVLVSVLLGALLRRQSH